MCIIPQPHDTLFTHETHQQLMLTLTHRQVRGVAAAAVVAFNSSVARLQTAAAVVRPCNAAEVSLTLIFTCAAAPAALGLLPILQPHCADAKGQTAVRCERHIHNLRCCCAAESAEFSEVELGASHSLAALVVGPMVEVNAAMLLALADDLDFELVFLWQQCVLHFVDGGGLQGRGQRVCSKVSDLAVLSRRKLGMLLWPAAAAAAATQTKWVLLGGAMSIT